MAVKKSGQPDSAAEAARFWDQIEQAWAAEPAEVNAQRAALARRDPAETEPATARVDEALDRITELLEAAYATMPNEELAAMDRVLARKLHAIDRAEIQAVTDGSDDGFLYARGFIVALGKEFYDAVDARPAMAILDAERERMCYLPAHVYRERFGDFPDAGSSISRETGSNRAGWPAG